jgi:membrane protease YdiL (CAAX protease family)
MGEIGATSKPVEMEGLSWPRLAAVAVVWVVMARYVPTVLWHAFPRDLLDALTLPVYSMLCQVVTTGAGVGLACLVMKRPGAALGVMRPGPWDAALTAVLTPAVFVAASYIALKIAEPYLLEELATQGAGASRRNAGEFGRAVTQAPLAMTLLWGAVLAAIAEEIVFRGAIFGAVEQALLVAYGRRRDEGRRLAGRTTAEWISGVIAIVVAAAAFGAMHADMKGSVGIVRVAATTCLGLACGTARLLSRTVLVSMLLHFTYNTISLGIGRGWFQGASEPLVSVVPNRLLVIAVVGLIVATAVAFLRPHNKGPHRQRI